MKKIYIVPVAIVVVICASLLLRPTNKLQLFPLYCEKPVQNNECADNINNIGKRQVYELDRSARTVKQYEISNTNDKSFENIKNLKSCTFVDINNWTCTYADDSGHFDISNGIPLDPSSSVTYRFYSDEKTWLINRDRLLNQ